MFYFECLDIGRLHNSQISNLRNGKLASPGPEVFLALAQVNTILDQGIEKIRDRFEMYSYFSLCARIPL